MLFFLPIQNGKVMPNSFVTQKMNSIMFSKTLKMGPFGPAPFHVTPYLILFNPVHLIRTLPADCPRFQPEVFYP